MPSLQVAVPVRAVHVLWALGRVTPGADGSLPRGALSAVASELEISRQNVHHYVEVLEQHGLLARESGRIVRLTRYTQNPKWVEDDVGCRAATLRLRRQSPGRRYRQPVADLHYVNAASSPEADGTTRRVAILVKDKRCHRNPNSRPEKELTEFIEIYSGLREEGPRLDPRNPNLRSVMARILASLKTNAIYRPLWRLWWEYEAQCARTAGVPYPPIRWYQNYDTVTKRVNDFDLAMGYRGIDVPALIRLFKACPHVKNHNLGAAVAMCSRRARKAMYDYGARRWAYKRQKPFDADTKSWALVPDFAEVTNWLCDRMSIWVRAQKVPSDSDVWKVLDPEDFADVVGGPGEAPPANSKFERAEWRQKYRQDQT